MNNCKYPFQPIEVLNLLGIYPETNSADIKLYCPFCGSEKKSKKLWINMQTGIFHCWRETCPVKSGNIVAFYAEQMGMEWMEAYKDICNRLRIKKPVDESEVKIRYRYIEKTETPEESPLADIKKRNQIYRLLLSNERCKLQEKHVTDLKKRGLDEDIIRMRYASVPNNENYALFNLCAEIQQEAGCDLSGVPGFYKAKNGKWYMKHNKNGIMVPVVSFDSMLQGIQIRRDNEVLEIDEDGEKEAKYIWLASRNKDSGCRPHVWIHYACDFKWDPGRRSMIPVCKNGRFCLIEGPMKADIFFHLTNSPSIAVTGVGCLKYLKEELEKLKSIGVHTIFICYDMDYITNKDVEKSIEKAKKIIEEVGMTCCMSTWPTEVEGQNVLKGIDDYYAYKLKGIIPKVK